MKHLAEHFYVIALDQIGFGYSTKPLLNYRIGTLVDFLYGFYQALDIKQAFLVGEGVGGCVAAALALQYPKLVGQLVLVSANPHWAIPEEYELLRLLPLATREQTRQLLQRLFYHKDRFVNDRQIDKLFTYKVMADDAYTTQRLTESIHRHEDTLEGRLSQLTVPTLILHGREDELASLKLSESLHRQIYKSELRIIKQCGHLPHIEQPEEFCAAVLQFLTIQSS